MTTFETLGYVSSEALRDAINSDLSGLAYPYTVKHKTYGEGQLTFVKAPLIGGSLYATIDFAIGTKTLSLDVVLTNNLLEMPLTLADQLTELQSVFKADFLEREEAQRAADRQAREQAAEAKKKAEEDKRNEERYEALKTKALKDFKDLALVPGSLSTEGEFYYALGWLTAHVGTVQAAIPDYLQSTFEERFGKEAKPYVYDSKKKTSGGFNYQWSAGFVARLRSKGLTEIPEVLTEYLSDHKSTSKKITNTKFIWDLIDNYGFQFGKTQDVDKIRSKVPAACLDSFEAGLLA